MFRKTSMKFHAAMALWYVGRSQGLANTNSPTHKILNAAEKSKTHAQKAGIKITRRSN